MISKDWADVVRRYIGHIAFKVFLWSIKMTSEEYLQKQAMDTIKYYEESVMKYYKEIPQEENIK
jgi:hypothetical protein